MAFVPGAALPVPAAATTAATSARRVPAMIRAPPSRPRTVVSPAAWPEDVATQPDSFRRERDREFYYDDLPTTAAAAVAAPAVVRDAAPVNAPPAAPAPPRRRAARTVAHDDDPEDNFFAPPAKAPRAVAVKTRRKRATLTPTEVAAAAKAAASRKKSVSDDSVRSYLHEIGEVKLLDAESEISLAREIAQLLALERVSAAFKEELGVDPTIPEWSARADMDIETFRDTLRRGLRAKEHMVAANLRLVVSIAKKYLNRGLSFQDLIQEGSIGLIRGAEKFDADKGFKFSTYATWWIRQAITRSIADHSRPIRLPVHVNDTIAAIKKTTKLLHTELNRPPSEAELADRMQLSIEKLRFLARSSRTTISLETPIGRDNRESNATLGSFIMWPGDTPEESTMKTLLREDLENVLRTLTPRERDVVRMRYGFDDGRMKTLEEIGTIFAVTRERIRQIEAKALRKLRHPNRNAVLREYVYEEP